jgi:hypothetical protein
MAICGLQNLLAGFVKHLFVIGVLPKNETLYDSEKTLALLLLGFFSGKLFRARGGIINYGSKKDRAAGS